jgi:hypothetical protein
MGIANHVVGSALAGFVLFASTACSSGSGGGAGGTGGIGNPDLDLTGPFAVDEDGGRIYWAVSKGIRSATLEGADQRTVFEMLERAPTRLRIDPTEQRLAWSDGEGVFSANLGGGAMQALGEGRHIDIAPGGALYVARDGQGIFKLSGGSDELVIDAPAAKDLAVSETRGKLFWIEGDAIYEAPLAGGTPSVVAGTEESKATQLELDPDTGDLYYRSSWETFRLPSTGGTPIQVVDRVRDPIHVDVLGGSHVYWSSKEYQEFWFADLTSAVDTLIEDPDGLGTFSVDEAHQKLFWIGGKEIRAADLDGQNPATVLAGVAGEMEHVRVDSAGAKVYVRTSNALARANLDGTALEVLVPNAQDGSTSIGGLQMGADIALDLPNQKLYWTIEDPTLSSQHAIVRGNLDGSAAVQLPGIALVSHSPIDVDSAAGKLYFVEKTGLGRANLDGSSVQSAPQAGIGTVVGLRVDVGGQKLYILEKERLSRTDLDFQNLEVVLDLPSTTYGLSFDASAGFLYYRPISGELYRLDVGTPGATPTLVTLPSGLLLTGSFTVSNGTVYLGTNDDHVARFELASPAPPEIILPRMTSPAGAVVVGDVLYWADMSEAWIGAADLDGKHPRVVHETPVEGNLLADPAGGGLFYTTDNGLFRLNLDTMAEEQLDTDHLRSLTASPTDLYFVPVDSIGVPGNTPSILKWTAGDTMQLIDTDTWYGDKPRALAWGDQKLYCVDLLGMLSTLSSDGATVAPFALIPGASALSLRSAYFQQSSRSLFFVQSDAIRRYAVPDSARIERLFGLN